MTDAVKKRVSLLVVGRHRAELARYRQLRDAVIALLGLRSHSVITQNLPPGHWPKIDNGQTWHGWPFANPRGFCQPAGGCHWQKNGNGKKLARLAICQSAQLLPAGATEPSKGFTEGTEGTEPDFGLVPREASRKKFGVILKSPSVPSVKPKSGEKVADSEQCDAIKDHHTCGNCAHAKRANDSSVESWRTCAAGKHGGWPMVETACDGWTDADAAMARAT